MYIRCFCPLLTQTKYFYCTTYVLLMGWVNSNSNSIIELLRVFWGLKLKLKLNRWQKLMTQTQLNDSIRGDWVIELQNNYIICQRALASVLCSVVFCVQCIFIWKKCQKCEVRQRLHQKLVRKFLLKMVMWPKNAKGEVGDDFLARKKAWFGTTLHIVRKKWKVAATFVAKNLTGSIQLIWLVIWRSRIGTSTKNLAKNRTRIERAFSLVGIVEGTRRYRLCPESLRRELYIKINSQQLKNV